MLLFVVPAGVVTTVSIINFCFSAQVVDEEDLLEEIVSKLRRRRRQAASDEEIGAIEDERLHVRARLAALRSVKLTELKGATAVARIGGHA